MPVYLASTNPGKLREFRDAARGHGIAVEPFPDIENLPACLEDGLTFEENARKKALHYGAYAVTAPVFADDSGLCVDALGGLPGVYSARFALLSADPGVQAAGVSAAAQPGRADLHSAEIGPGQDPDLDTANNARLIRELDGVPAERRGAHYVCLIALARAAHILIVTEGRVDGVILEEPRGRAGFGYDPYFYYPPLARTFAELEAHEKYAVSHRGEAFRKLIEYLHANQFA